MQYLLMVYNDESMWPTMTRRQQEQGVAAYMAYSEALANAGALLGSNRLAPSSSATTVRVAEGKPQVLNGPYADTKEQLGGYFLIDVPDLDAAIAWAARCPGAGHGVVEVRPLWAQDDRAGAAGANGHEAGG
ncbi:MAG TPA: YciI family protein [Gammaproteobacteria bacterium]